MMNRKMNGFFAYVLLAVVLSSCGHSIHEGEIIEKYYEPERTYTYTTMIMCGKVMIPQTHTGYDDEDWIIVVKGVNGKDTITEDFYIDEANWKCMSVGNIFNDSIPCTTDDDGTK
jgi:hypothetical protein